MYYVIMCAMIIKNIHGQAGVKSNEWFVHYYLNQTDVTQFWLAERHFRGKIICSYAVSFSLSGFVFLMRDASVSAAISSGWQDHKLSLDMNMHLIHSVFVCVCVIVKGWKMAIEKKIIQTDQNTDRSNIQCPSFLKCKWLCWDWLELHC